MGHSLKAHPTDPARVLMHHDTTGKPSPVQRDHLGEYMVPNAVAWQLDLPGLREIVLVFETHTMRYWWL